jgi:hypothetical protein
MIETFIRQWLDNTQNAYIILITALSQLTVRTIKMLASIFNAPAKRFILIIHSQPCITSEIMQLTFNSKAEAKAEAKKRNLKAWNYSAPFNSEFLGAQPARAGEDY